MRAVYIRKQLLLERDQKLDSSTYNMLASFELKLCTLISLLGCYADGKALLEDVDVEGYFWRDYLGKIPYDAVQGGPDGSGDTMYVGQTVFMGLKGPILVPGQISEQNQTLYFEWGLEERSETENIKILCAAHPEQFEWVRTSTEEITRLADRHLVLGGFEGNYTVYVGRVLAGDQWTIAKVLVVNDKALLHATKNGKDDYHHKFEILSYNPDIPPVEHIRKSVQRRIQAESSSGRMTYYPSYIFGILLLFSLL